MVKRPKSTMHPLSLAEISTLKRPLDKYEKATVAKSEALKKSIKRNDTKRMKEFDHGVKHNTPGHAHSFASQAAKVAIKKSDADYERRDKERRARYKREGITE